MRRIFPFLAIVALLLTACGSSVSPATLQNESLTDLRTKQAFTLGGLAKNQVVVVNFMEDG